MAGLRDKDKDFWEYVYDFDYIGLVETWMEERAWKTFKRKLWKRYIWKHQSAKREWKKGRAKDGILTGVRRDCEMEGKMEEEEGVIGRWLRIDGEKWKVWAVYNNEGMAKMARKLRRVIEEEETEKTIIGGDFNARTGEEGYIYAEETMKERKGKYRERKSKNNVKNAEGNFLLSLTENRDGI